MNKFLKSVVAASLTLATLFGGALVAAPATAAVTTASWTNTRQIVVIGDSFASGFNGSGFGTNGWPWMVAQDNCADLTLNAVPGTGYQRSSTAGLPYYQRWSEGLSAETDVVIVQGSANDWNQSQQLIYSRASATYKAIKSVAVNARIVVIGPIYSKAPNANIQFNEDAVRAAANANGVQFADASNWFAPYPEMIDTTGHPNNTGHIHLRAMVESVTGLEPNGCETL
jgi:lysophospholipase L1-like esterase